MWQQSKAQEDHAAYKGANRDANTTMAVEEQWQHNNFMRHWTLDKCAIMQQ